MSEYQGTSQYYVIKTTIEQLFGKKAWREIKETTDIKTWKKYAKKIINAIRISIEESIEIRDDEWFKTINENLDSGLSYIKSSNEIDDLFACLTATLTKQVFLQIGFMPNHIGTQQVTLRKDNWRLNIYRSVQYVQSAKQTERKFYSEQQKEIGFPAQRELLDKYQIEKSSLPFSTWCKEKN